MNKFALNTSELKELNSEDLMKIEGGIGIIDDIIIGVVAGLVISAIDNWGDIREGWHDGISGAGSRY